MHERDQIFRERLVALIEVLNSPEGRNRSLRNRIGAISARLAKEAGARNWADLKQRADGPTYDSLLRLFQRESEGADQAGDTRVTRAMEVLAISLISRRQQQVDLVPGVDFLDNYIEGCETAARRAKTQVLPPVQPKH
jgi:hypothetical protein